MSAKGSLMYNKKKYELAEIAYQLAHDYDLESGNSSQSVLIAIQDTFGVVTDEVIKAAHILSGGGGLTGIGICGALVGGLIALSCNYGIDRKKFGKVQSTKCMLKGRLLVKRFEKEYGGISCNNIQKKLAGRTYDMWADDDEEFRENYYCEMCPKVCGNVAKWVVALI